MRFVKRFWWVILLVPLMAAAGFVLWASTPLGPMPEALQALNSDAQVQVTSGEWYAFIPIDHSPDMGVILYPGGRVDPRSYAPMARALAENGYLAVITPMPLNLAVFAPGRAADVIAAFPEIKHWAVGGHSLGGSMAANFVSRNPGVVQGLYFWASYPASSDDLSGQTLQVLSIYGTLDSVASLDTILGSQALLPSTTLFIAIQGGNHAQFGYYGDQPGDTPATISREEQQAQTLEAMLDLLGRLVAYQLPEAY